MPLQTLQSFYESALLNISIILAGVAGGSVALIRAAKKKKTPIRLGGILSSLFVASFTAYMVSLLLPDTINSDLEIVICGISGMCGDRILILLEHGTILKIKRFLRRWSK